MSDSLSYEAVIFDLDGTLLDTLQDLGDAMNRVLARHDFPRHPAASYRKFVGDGARKLVERALPEKMRSEENIESLLREFLDDYRENWARATAPYPGIPELLDGLARRGVRMAVLSNKIHEYTVSCVERFFDISMFEAVLGEREGVPRKPDPAGALEIARRMNVACERIVYVGDTSIDMKTGRRAGMFAVGVSWGFRQPQELEENGAMLVIERPGQLLGLF